MIALVVLAAIIGLAYGRLPWDVARRVFADPAEPLLTRSDAVPGPVTGFFAEPSTALGRIVMGALFGLTAWVIGSDWTLPAYLFFVAVTVTLTVTDLDRKLIPNRILFPSLGIGGVLLVGGGLIDGEAFALGRAALGGLIYFGVLLVVAIVARGGFGMGDVKLALLLGSFLAYQSTNVLWVGAVGAFLLGGVVSLLLLVTRIKSRKDAIPFGPYLVVAAYVAIAAGEEIADWYLG